VTAAVTADRIAIVANLGGLHAAIAAANTGNPSGRARIVRFDARAIRGTPIRVSRVGVVAAFVRLSDAITAGAAGLARYWAKPTGFDGASSPAAVTGNGQAAAAGAGRIGRTNSLIVGASGAQPAIVTSFTALPHAVATAIASDASRCAAIWWAFRSA
jgi:hypothetical protein